MHLQRASVSGLVVCLVVSCMAIVGLSLEGGRVVRTYAELASLSSSVARIGGQEISGIQDGSIHIDRPRALKVMKDYLRAHEEVADFQIGETSISVTLHRRVRTSFLRLVGVSSRNVSVTRTVIVLAG